MGSVVTVPLIISIEPAFACIIDTVESFFNRVFEIVIDVASTVMVWVNNAVAFAVSTYETIVSWIFDTATTIIETGVNIIRIVVSNDAGSTEKIIQSVITSTPVTSAPEITSTTPEEQSISDVLGGSGTRHFGVTVDQPVTIIFSVDGQEKRRFDAVTNAEWDCDFSGYSAGMHSVTVTAENSNGNDSFEWSWEILPMPVITFENPSTENVSNYDSEGRRTFSASVNIPCSLELYFNGGLIEQSSSEVMAISHEFGAVPTGTHSVKVIAKKFDAEVDKSWNWDFSEYPSSDIIYCSNQYYSGLRSATCGASAANVIEKNLNFYSNSELRCQKTQLPDGSWIYLFTLALNGLVLDDENNEPPIVNNYNGFGKNLFLSGFSNIEINISETYNKNDIVLFSATDRYCYGIYPLKGETLDDYYDDIQSKEMIWNLLSFLPKISFLIDSINLLSPNNSTPEIETILSNFDYEVEQEINPDGGRSPHVENIIRWITWVHQDDYVRFNLNVKLKEDYTIFFEINEEIEILAPNVPSIFMES